ncbi:MAG TPA: VOC family protein [Candidatus Angelobacter sp.]|nr:VOC family protein [Candidatus Angelobacter sp.]
MLKAAIPLLHISNAAAAEEFYCNRLGFRREFAHRAHDAQPDPCYMGISRDGVWLNLSSFFGDGVSGGVANLLVDDVDAFHAEFLAKGVRIDPGHPVDQTWGSREMYVRDPDGNTLRFIQG